MGELSNLVGHSRRVRVGISLHVTPELESDAAFDVQGFVADRATRELGQFCDEHGLILEPDTMVTERTTAEQHYDRTHRWWEILLRRPARQGSFTIIMYVTTAWAIPETAARGA